MKARLLSVFSEVSAPRVDRKKLTALVEILDESYQPKNKGELSLAFVHHERLAQMHAGFCGDPTPTDIITFPPTFEDAEVFGELCISPQAAAEWVKKHGGKFEEELKRYVIHGYLHLLGYDDLEPKKKRQMRAQEKKCLLLAKHIKGIFTFAP